MLISGSDNIMPDTVENLMQNNPTMSGSAQEQYAGREMRQNKMDNDLSDQDEQPQSLRQRLVSARRAMDLKQRAKDKLEEKVTAPMRAGTSRLLQQSWLSILYTGGLSIIFLFFYINIHVFLRFVLGEKIFCKLGDEWVPKKIKAMGGEAGKMGSRAIGIVEVMGLILLDVVVLSVVFVALALIIMIITWVGASWWEKLKVIYEALSSLGWATISGLKDLF